MITAVFIVMVGVQSVAYLWFQSKGGIVSHKNYISAHALFMIGQLAQIMDSTRNGAWASFFIATFYLIMTGIGIFNRFRIMKRDGGKLLV